MKVRIIRTPHEEEVDGVRLDDMTPGSVREVSASIGTWLVVQGYAELEMRLDNHVHEEDFLIQRDTAADRVIRARRRSHDRR